jgi:fimbrial chaperone protein
MQSKFILAFGLGALACAAQATGIAVMPVGMVLSARQDRQAVSVQNQGAERVLLQVDAVSWTQEDGTDRHEATSDLVVNPAVFAIEPGQTQTVRVGLRNKPASAQEVAYRLVLRQVPVPAADAPAFDSELPGQVRVLLQLRLPVYVLPADPKRSQQWQAWRLPDGKVAVEMQNTGTVHQTITALDLHAGDALPASIRAGTAVLPGQKRRWDFPADAAAQQVVLEAATDAGPQRVPLTLQAR